MKSFFLIAINFVTIFCLSGQNPVFNFTKQEVESNLKYIASDELQGRRTASKGEQKAADFIAKAWNEYGVKTISSLNGYFQKVPFKRILPPKEAALNIGEAKFNLNDNLLIIKTSQLDQKAQLVFAGHGWVDEAAGHDDYKGLDVKGKIVITVTGLPTGNTPNDVFSSMQRKQELAARRGAIALIETYRIALPWQFAQGYFKKERMEVDHEAVGKTSIAYGWVQEKGEGALTTKLNQTKQMATLKIVPGIEESISSSNIVGYIQGSDDLLRNEIVLLSAHYDHVGTGKQGGAAFTPQDSIFNGTRDNGIGVVALMAAAKDLAANPPKRSVLLLACTAEEMGMLGSQWFADNLPVQLDKVVFNLNTDGAGYNSTAHFNVIGKGLTNVDEELEKAGSTVGLAMLGDPAPEQGLYERSDNISFAAKGIPAVDFAPGITAMDETVFKYYHQAADNTDSIDYDYLLKYCQAYTMAARLVADKAGKIDWTKEGSKYKK